MLRLDKQTAADWVDTYSAAFRAGDGARTSTMLSEMSLWSRQSLAAHLADYRDASEGLDVIIDGLRRLRVAVPASMIAARDACMLAAGMTVTEQPSLTRRARLIIIGGAAVAAAAAGASNWVVALGSMALCSASSKSALRTTGLREGFAVTRCRRDDQKMRRGNDVCDV